jgi:hypothetical protein
MPGCNSHKKYDPSSSSSAKQVTNEKGEGSTEISFGTGQISGDYYEDTFCIGDSSLCTQARFIASTEQSPEPFSETPFDGILGMGFNDLSMGKQFNIVDDLNDSNQLPQGTFSVFLSDDGESEMTFGGYRPEQLASDVVWADVDRQSYWQVAVDDITFNNEVSNLCDGKCQVAVDTGTSMLAGPSDLVDKLSDKVSAKDDCSNFATLPTLGFKIGDKVLNLSPDDYMDKSAGDCSFSLMALDVPPPKGPLFIFGDPFLRRFVTIYDRSGPRVGFAVAKHGNMDAAQAGSIISQYGGSSSASPSMSSSPASAGFDPKQVEVSLDSGMMTGDPHSHDDDTSASTDKAPDASATKADTSASTDTVAEKAATDTEVDKILETADDAAKTAPSSASRVSDDIFSKTLDDDSDAAKQPAKAEGSADVVKPAEADPSASSSDDALWAPKKLGAFSFDSKVQALKEQEDGTDLVKEFSSKWREETAPPKRADAPPADDFAAEMKRLSSSFSRDVFVQNRAGNHASHHMVRPGGPHLVSVKLFRTDVKETVRRA